MKTRAEALALLHEFTQSESLRKHALSVEAAMQWYANHLRHEDEIELWGFTGLLHDFDYEKFPDPIAPEGHPFKGVAILRELGYPESLCEAILGHAHYTGVARVTPMAKALFAVDELSGLITAATLVRPDKSIHNLEVKSVLKKMKDKAFARSVSRDDITLGSEQLGIPLDQHVQNVIAALRGVSSDLGLGSSPH